MTIMGNSHGNAHIPLQIFIHYYGQGHSKQKEKKIIEMCIDANAIRLLFSNSKI